VTLETTYGHDSFLLEDELQAPHIRRFLDQVGEGRA
jgi:homoserine acetyltransferase